MDVWTQWDITATGDLKQTNMARVTDGDGISVMFRMPQEV